MEMIIEPVDVEIVLATCLNDACTPRYGDCGPVA